MLIFLRGVMVDEKASRTGGEASRGGGEANRAGGEASRSARDQSLTLPALEPVTSMVSFMKRAVTQLAAADQDTSWRPLLTSHNL